MIVHHMDISMKWMSGETSILYWNKNQIQIERFWNEWHEFCRDSVSDFTSDYKIDGHDGNFENHASNIPHTSGKKSHFDFLHFTCHVLSSVYHTKFDVVKIGTIHCHLPFYVFFFFYVLIKLH